jgi:hypothetical protein
VTLVLAAIVQVLVAANQAAAEPGETGNMYELKIERIPLAREASEVERADSGYAYRPQGWLLQNGMERVFAQTDEEVLAVIKRVLRIL